MTDDSIPDPNHIPVAPEEAVQMGLPAGCAGFETPVYDAIMSAMREPGEPDNTTYPDKTGALWRIWADDAQGNRKSLVKARAPVPPVDLSHLGEPVDLAQRREPSFQNTLLTEQEARAELGGAPPHHKEIATRNKNTLYRIPEDGGVLARVDYFTERCFQAAFSAGWWHKDGESLIDKRNPTALLLIHSEISEAYEGYNFALMDDKLPHRSMFEVEMADTAVRIFDLLGSREARVGGMLNVLNEDRTVEPRHFDAWVRMVRRWTNFVMLMERGTRDGGTFSAGGSINKGAFVPEGLLQLHARISEAMEFDRRADDQMLDYALVNALRYCVTLAEAAGCDLVGAIEEKLAFNARRADHKPENRVKSGGKRY